MPVHICVSHHHIQKIYEGICDVPPVTRMTLPARLGMSFAGLKATIFDMLFKADKRMLRTRRIALCIVSKTGSSIYTIVLKAFRRARRDQVPPQACRFGRFTWTVGAEARTIDTWSSSRIIFWWRGEEAEVQSIIELAFGE